MQLLHTPRHLAIKTTNLQVPESQQDQTNQLPPVKKKKKTMAKTTPPNSTPNVSSCSSQDYLSTHVSITMLYSPHTGIQTVEYVLTTLPLLDLQHFLSITAVHSSPPTQQLYPSVLQHVLLQQYHQLNQDRCQDKHTSINKAG